MGLAVIAIVAMSLNGGFSNMDTIYADEEVGPFDLINSCVGEEVLPLVPDRFQKVSVALPKVGVRAEACRLDYMRNEEEWISKQQQHTTCQSSSSVEVYAWLMDKVNCFGDKYAFMVAYGELIHLLRDKAMLHPDGSYIDDDFDTWVTVPTVSNPVSLICVSS